MLLGRWQRSGPWQLELVGDADRWRTSWDRRKGCRTCVRRSMGRRGMGLGPDLPMERASRRKLRSSALYLALKDSRTIGATGRGLLNVFVWSGA